LFLTELIARGLYIVKYPPPPSGKGKRSADVIWGKNMTRRREKGRKKEEKQKEGEIKKKKVERKRKKGEKGRKGK
jgi:hypothetical protein